MRYRSVVLASLFLAGLASQSFGQVSIGKFAGGVAETGWGRFSAGVQPLDADVYTVTDLDTSGDGGSLETDIPNFSDSWGYSFTTAGTVSDFFNHRKLTFDLIYRGTPTDNAQGGFSQVFQVIFQSNNNSFASTAYQSNENLVPLNQFGGGGTAVGWGAGTSNTQTVLNVTVDYTTFLNTLPINFNPSTLQVWFSTNDSNRKFKAIDDVQLTGFVPEPASFFLFGLGMAGLLAVRRRKVARSCGDRL